MNNNLVFKLVVSLYVLLTGTILLSVTALFFHYYPQHIGLLWMLPISVILLLCYRFLPSLAIPFVHANFYFTVFLIAIITAIVQVAFCFTYPFTNGADALVVEQQAKSLATTFQLLEEYRHYFTAFPNNLNITILFGGIYKMFGSWYAVRIIGALLTNVSAVLACLTVWNYTKSPKSSIVTLLVAEFLLSFTIWAYIPYTHSYGIIFPIVLVFLYSSALTYKKKWAFIIFFALLGYFIKVTTLIPFIAIGLLELMMTIRYRKWKKSILFVSSCCLLFFLFSYAQDYLHTSVGYRYNENLYNSASYFVMLGQCTASRGACMEEYSALSWNYNRPKKQRDSLFYSIAKDNVIERKFIGNIDFYVGKLAMCWGDATWDSYKSDCKNPKIKKLLNLFKYSRQIFWYMVLIMLPISAFCAKRKYGILYISMIGIVTYLLLLEAESRYIFMFAPIHLVIWGTSLYEVDFRKVKSRYLKRKQLKD